MKLTILLLAPALAALLAAEPQAPTPAAAWVIVQTDGARVTFEAPPEVRSGRFVGRLRGSGTLVSIPAARVDTAATVRANATGAPAVATPSPASRTPRPFETPPLGDRVRLSKSGEEARRALEGARTGTPPPARPAATPGVAAAPEETAPTDRLGRDETYWRERAGGVRAEAQEAERTLADAEADLEAAERAYLGGSEAERTTFVLHVVEARERAEAARREHRRASAQWEALQEEARKAGAFPGWLR